MAQPVLLFNVVFVAQCTHAFGSEEEPVSPATATTTAVSYTSLPQQPNCETSESFAVQNGRETVFDDATVQSWMFTVPQDGLDFLLEDPTKEEYTDCTICFGGYSFEGAGCRFKLLDTKDDNCLFDSNGNSLLPLNSIHDVNCRALSWKVDANKFREDSQKIFGFKKLNFHSMSSSNDFIRERIGFEMMNSVIESPLAVHVNLFLNEELLGLFLLVEQVDDVFTEHHFSFDDNDGEGALFEDIWPNALSQSYYKDFEEEDSKKADRQVFVDFAQSSIDLINLNSFPTTTEALDLADRFWDVDNMAKVAAMSTLLNHYENIYAVLCESFPCEELVDDEGDVLPSVTDDQRFHRNFYLYVEKEGDDRRLKIIPEDLPSVLLLSQEICEDNPSMNDLEKCRIYDFKYRVPFWWILPEDIGISSYPQCQVPEELIWSASSADESYIYHFSCDATGKVIALAIRDLWRFYLNEYINIFNAEWFEMRVEEIANQIRDFIPLSQTAEEGNDDGIEEWLIDVEALLPTHSSLLEEANRLIYEVPFSDESPILTPQELRAPLVEIDQDYIWDSSYIRNWYIHIPEGIPGEGLDFLLADPAAEEYTECQIEYEGHYFEGCGCRFKGSGSTLNACLEDKSYNLTSLQDVSCRTLSWKIDANHFVDDDQKIFGLKKLQFHGMSHGVNYISEKLSYELLAEQGLNAPRANYVNVYINGILEGLYLLVEQIDKSFTIEQFPEDDFQGDGTLYKEIMWNALESDYYDKVYEEEDGGGSFGELCVNFILAAIEAKENEVQAEEAKEILQSYFEYEKFVTYLAMIDFTNNYDSYLWVVCNSGVNCKPQNDSCSVCSPLTDPDDPTRVVESMTGDDRFMHNYYVYVNQQNGLPKFTFVPWDYDLSFKWPFNYFAPKPHWTVLRTDEECRRQYDSLGRMSAISFSCDDVGALVVLATREDWKLKLSELLDFYSTELLTSKILELKANIEETVASDPLTESVDEWNAEVEKLVSGLGAIRQNVEQLLFRNDF